MSDTIEGTIAKIIGRFDTTVYCAMADGWVAKGPPDGDGPVVGEHYRFTGEWENHPKYGRQFQFSFYVKPAPHGASVLINYLCRQPGIGQATAQRLYELYGESVLDVLADKPAEVADAIPRLSLAKVEEIAELVRADRQDQQVKVALHGLLDGKGFPRATVGRAIKKWKHRAADFVRRDPFLLLQYPGAGFSHTDKLYLALGRNPARLKRQALAGWYSMRERSRSEGHTWLPVVAFSDGVRQHIAGTRAKPDRALELLLRAGKLTQRKDRLGRKWIADRGAAMNERIAACQIRQLLSEGDAA